VATPRLVDHRAHHRPPHIGVQRGTVANLVPTPVQRDERRLRQIVRTMPVTTQQVRTSAHGIAPSGEVLRELLLVVLIHADSLRSLSLRPMDGPGVHYGCTVRR
jgi:hypothetical protein